MTLREREGESPRASTTGSEHRNQTSVAEITCSDVCSQLGDYLDGTLDSPARERLARHISQCPQCRSLQRDMEQTVRGARNLPRVKLPEGARDRLRKRIAEEERARDSDA